MEQIGYAPATHGGITMAQNSRQCGLSAGGGLTNDGPENQEPRVEMEMP